MEKDTRDLLDAELAQEIEKLGKMTPGSPEHEKATEAVAKLYRLKIDEDKAADDLRETIDKNTYDDQFRREELKQDKFHQRIKLGIDAAGVILPLMFYGIWMGKGLKFEQTGTFTSQTFRGLMGKFRLGK